MNNLVQIWSGAFFEVRDVILIGLVVVLLEIVVWRRTIRDLFSRSLPSSARVNMMVLLFNWLVVSVPLVLAITFVYQVVAAHGVALVPASVFQSMPDWCVVLLSLVVGDLVVYWRHRLQHSHTLWRFHNLHHSDEQMTWMTLARFHPVDRFMAPLIDLSVLAMLGFPAWAVAASMAIFHYFSYVAHADLPWTFGPLRKVFVSPAQHRWHHSLREAGYRSNFAGVFSFIDVLFGTFYCPGPCTEATGVEGEHIHSFTALMLKPLLPAGRPREPVSSSYVPIP